MRIRRPFALAAAAALVAGLAVTAYAEAPAVHLLRVALPDGRVETIRYTGDVAPRVIIAPVEEVAGIDPPTGLDPSTGLDPFAGFDAIAAMMAAQSEAMMRAAAMMPAPGGQDATADGGLRIATLADAPAGARSVSVSTVTVNGRTCTTRVETVAQGAGHRPRLLRQVSGDGCAAGGPKAALPQTPATPVPPVPPTPPASRKAPARDTI